MAIKKDPDSPSNLLINSQSILSKKRPSNLSKKRPSNLLRDSQRDSPRDSQRDSPRNSQRDSSRNLPRNSQRDSSRNSQRDSSRNLPRNSQRDSSRNSPSKINVYLKELRNSEHSILKEFNHEILITDISIFKTELNKILKFIEAITDENIVNIRNHLYGYQNLPEDIDVLNYLRIELRKILKLKLESGEKSIKYTIMINRILAKIIEKLEE